MTLQELCEPLFQYVCRLNRAGRKGGNIEYAAVRSDVIGLLDSIRREAGTDFKTKNQFQAVERPLLFFVDSMIAESKLPCNQQWHKSRLAFANDGMAGDEKFFDLLEDTLKDPSDEATERLTIYYTCLGLGFTGFYVGQPEYLRKRMEDIKLRIRGHIEGDSRAKICPEAYQHTDTNSFIEPPTGRVWLMVAVFAVCALTALGCNLHLFQKAAGELKESLAFILKQEEKLGRQTNETGGSAAPSKDPIGR